MSKQIDILYTNIGRGHPFYLDGISQELVRSGKVNLIHSQNDVFQLSVGMSKLAWNTARWLYTAGSSSTAIGALYKQIRSGNDYNNTSASLKILGRDIRKHFKDRSLPVLVAHPSLVGILKEQVDVIYQHGELVAPEESLVRGAKTVMVPTERVAEAFSRVGYSPESILVTGLCVEPFIARKGKELYLSRRERIARGDTLTGAFFSSGAEPLAHVSQLVTVAKSSADAGGNVIIFASKGGNLARMAQRSLSSSGYNPVVFDCSDLIPHELPQVSIVLFCNRREEEALSTQLFERFDYVVAPSHERSNWGAGMGLPMFILTPAIGPFAPLNLRFLIEQGVGQQIDNSMADMFGQFLAQKHRNGGLLSMCEAGFGKYTVNGFEIVARHLSEQYGN